MTKQAEDPGYPRPPFPEQTQPWSHESGFTTGNVRGSTGGETGP